MGSRWPKVNTEEHGQLCHSLCSISSWAMRLNPEISLPLVYQWCNLNQPTKHFCNYRERFIAEMFRFFVFSQAWFPVITEILPSVYSNGRPMEQLQMWQEWRKVELMGSWLLCYFLIFIILTDIILTDLTSCQKDQMILSSFSPCDLFL